MKLHIYITGICSILRKEQRILLPNATRSKASCDSSVLPIHRAYIRYALNDDRLQTPFDISNGKGLGAIFLNGEEIIIKGTPVNTSTAPAKIPKVASMEDIFPGLVLDPKYLVPPEDLSHVEFSAYLALAGGSFQAPNPNIRRNWHFFPQKGAPIRGPLAQVVLYEIELRENNCVIAVKPFGKGTKAVDLLNLKNQDSDIVEIVIGNTPPDPSVVFPNDTTKQPPIGPDPHFEIYYRMAMNPGACPVPIPHYEGEPGMSMMAHSGHNAHVHAQPRREVGTFGDAAPNFDALGGANCPPNQWP